MIHPDVYDVGSVQYHGSSFHRYDSYLIGFMFRANYTLAKHPMGSGYGPYQAHLAYSYDGQHFNQLYREPIIPRTQPGQEAEKGYTYNDCVPLAYADSTEFQLRFRAEKGMPLFNTSWLF